MGNQVVDNKFTWVIKAFSVLVSNTIYSDPFVIGGCKWRLTACTLDKYCLSLFLEVVDYGSLPHGWRRHARYLLTVVNQSGQKSSIQKGISHWFNQMDPSFGHHLMCPVSEIIDKDSGFIMDVVLKIVVEVDLLEVIGNLDVSKLEDDVMESNDFPKESIDINGFQLLPSQVEFVKRVFEKRPGIALVFQAKNQPLRKACMYVFLSLMETLSKSLEELSNDDLWGGDCSLTYLKHSGFKVDWLEKRLEEVKEKKKEEQIGETRMKELEEELKDLKQKSLDKEALLKISKAKVLATRASRLTLHDLV